MFINWFAGLAGGLCSISLFSPFDLARTRHIVLSTTKSHGIVKYNGLLQTLSRIYIDEGFRGLYKGYVATALTVPIFHSLYFSIFYRTKKNLDTNLIPENRTVLRDMIASLYAGFVANTVTNPLWVVRTRIQSQFLHRDDTSRYTGVIQGLRKICNEEGVKSLSKGLLASYMGLAHCVILFPLYEHLKMQLANRKGELSTADVLIASNISKIVAMTLTYPHIVVRARLQDSRSPRMSFTAKSNSKNTLIMKSEHTITSVLSNIYKAEGVRGLFNGFRIDMIRCLPANSVTFLVFEYAKNRLEKSLASEGDLGL